MSGTYDKYLDEVVEARGGTGGGSYVGGAAIRVKNGTISLLVDNGYVFTVDESNYFKLMYDAGLEVIAGALRVAAGKGLTLNFSTGTVDAAPFEDTDTTAIPSGTVAVAEWMRYTGICDTLTVSSVPNSEYESELLVTFAGTATAPDIGLPVGTKYAGAIPTYAAGKSYLLNVRNGIVVIAEVKTVTAGA